MANNNNVYDFKPYLEKHREKKFQNIFKLYEQEKFKQVLNEIGLLEKGQPLDSDLRNIKVYALMREERFDEALAENQKMIEDFSYNNQYFRLGNVIILEELGRFDEALDELEEVENYLLNFLDQAVMVRKSILQSLREATKEAKLAASKPEEVDA